MRICTAHRPPVSARLVFSAHDHIHGVRAIESAATDCSVKKAENMMARWLITGAGAGIGRALAEAALRRGDSIAGTIRSAAAARKFSALDPALAHPVKLDLADGEVAIRDAVQQAVDTLGGLDIVVSNAGISLFGAVEECSVAEARAIFEVNVFAPLQLIRETLPHLRAAGGGRLILMSSGSGINATPGLGIYSASKFALEGMAEALAKEVTPQGIEVMLVEPGAVATGFIARSTREAADRLPAYAALSSAGKAMLKRYYETAAAAPDAIACAIVAALDHSPLPLRLVPSEDVRRSIAARAEALRLLTAEY